MPTEEVLKRMRIWSKHSRPLTPAVVSEKPEKRARIPETPASVNPETHAMMLESDGNLEMTPSTSRSCERRDGDKDCRRCYPCRPKPRHACFTEGDECLIARVSTGSAVQQHSSAADKGWRFVPDAILPGHWRAPQWVLARTPTLGPE